MSLRKILADDLKWRAVGRMEAGQSQAEVAKWLNVNKSVVSKIWKQFIETGTIKRKEGSGRKRKTATSEDRYLVVTAKRHREMTAIQLSNGLPSATGTRVSRQTVYRRLHEGALYARRPMWANVLFSDESRFSLNTDSRRDFIWREPGTRYHPSNIREIDSFRGGSLLVWAGISSSRRTPLHIFSRGTLTAQRYRDEILETYLRPYRDQIGHNLIFMDDNARPHRARLVNEYLQSENIRRMDWPARSPDLNPIEHVWDALGRRIGAHYPSPRTLVELRTALLEEWGLLPLDLLQSLVNSMRARCETLIAVRAAPYMEYKRCSSCIPGLGALTGGMAGGETNGKLEEEAFADDGVLLQPFHYILSVPGKEVRTRLTKAFNHWLAIPADKCEAIGEVVKLLHNASLLIDDIEDNSKLRRGIPVAHHVFGVASTINAANYVYFLGLEKTLQLGNPEATAIYTEQMLELHRGQGMDIYWRDNYLCPTEEEYMQMVRRKTGGLFGLAVRLMQLFSDNKADFSKLWRILGLYFQIRDDYANLTSKEYTENKSYCEDLTEGKFSFPIIRAIKSHPENTQILNIIRQRPSSLEIKQYAVQLLEKLGAFEYTRSVLAKLDQEARDEIARLGDNIHLVNVLDSLKTW
ncbi:GGPS1 [Cordylochernes scorpioides]|uniref:GGPS1 n=1 Tax=Cordylochernes scorpioides TaxID=51811 RepID=A0ABY6LAP1_9ARAC|nr:GGPS1 [Cordylochernes scorpioides]